jgi:serine/threonine-protein kinase
VQLFPGPGGKWQVSTEGGDQPVWARYGRELFYREEDKMMAVQVTTRPTFSAGKSTVLFAGQYVHHPPLDPTDYDVTPDGRRFLMLQPSEQKPIQHDVDLLSR